ncbi:MAG: carbohydrate ABC transporter permease [Demequina sp.]|uniref:carbohydrate ABC transporter permease n=1 Tax=Demequina sp. TaxID=2050685 RepID=UPI003A83986F
MAVSPATVVPPTARRKRASGARHEARTGWVLIAPFALLFLLVFVIPIAVSIKEALFSDVPTGDGLYGGGELASTFVGFDNFANVIGDERFWRGVGRVGLFGIIQVPLMIGLALGLALMLDSWIIRRVTTFRLGYFLPYAIPGVVAAMVWLYLYTPEISPITDALAGLGIDANLMGPGTVIFSMANMTTWTYTGYNMLIFLAALQAIPRELYEAARVDGASGWQVVWRIKIPLVGSAALLAVLLSIIGTVQLFNEPTVLSSVNSWMGADYVPMMFSYNTMMGQVSPSGAGPASAISIVMALLAGVLAAGYALLQRRLSR